MLTRAACTATSAVLLSATAVVILFFYGVNPEAVCAQALIAPGVNMLSNGSFESDGAGGIDPPSGWRKSGGSFSTSAERVHGGSYAAKSTAGSGGAYRLYQSIPVTEGEIYEMEGWIYDDTGSAFGCIQYDLYDSHGGLLGGGSVGSTEDGNSSQWQYVSTSVVARPRTASITFYCLSMSSTGSGPWGPVLYDDLSVRAVDTSSVEPGDVVINEIGWAGTAAGPADEWIELYNTTDRDIDMENWAIYREGGSDMIDSLANTIAAHGYYLMMRNDDYGWDTVQGVDWDWWYYFCDLADRGEHLQLKYGTTVVDEVNCTGGWFAGRPDGCYTMERIDSAGPASDPSNWASNDGVTTNGLDANGNRLNGTARSVNSATVGSQVPPTPTPAPAVKPLEIILSSTQAAPGATFSIDVRLRPVALPFAAWGAVTLPTGKILFITPGGLSAEPQPYAVRTTGLQEGGQFRVLTVAPIPPGTEGIYPIAIGLLPPGAPPSRAAAFLLDEKQLTIE
jgi:hypothetical protein